MKVETIQFNMFDGTKKTEITKEESIGVESVMIRQTLDKEEAKEYLKQQTLIQEYIRNDDIRADAIRRALGNVNGLIIATYDTIGEMK